MGTPKGPGDIKIGTKYQYVDLPKSMEECFYDLELKEVKELDSGNIAFVWTVLDTDTKVKVDSEISLILYPKQKLARVYFWKELFMLTLALTGKEASQKRVDKLKEKYKKVYKRFLKTDDFVGSRARCRIVSYENDDGVTKTRRVWEILENE